MDFQEKRRERLEGILADRDRPVGERLDAALAFMEAELKAAFVRGLRSKPRKQPKP